MGTKGARISHWRGGGGGLFEAMMPSVEAI